MPITTLEFSLYKKIFKFKKYLFYFIANDDIQVQIERIVDMLC